MAPWAEKRTQQTIALIGRKQEHCIIKQTFGATLQARHSFSVLWTCFDAWLNKRSGLRVRHEKWPSSTWGSTKKRKHQEMKDDAKINKRNDEKANEKQAQNKCCNNTENRSQKIKNLWTRKKAGVDRTSKRLKKGTKGGMDDKEEKRTLRRTLLHILFCSESSK